MADDVTIKVRLQGAAAVAKDTALIATGLKKIGSESRSAATSAKIMGSAVTTATGAASRGLGAIASQAKYGALGIVGLAAAGAKWGLGFNAQVESARLRFGLFTDDVDGLMKSVQHIDLNSAFNFADLADSAALLGNSGVKDIPGVLQAAANAAAASGKGLPALQGISIALSQIAAKGRLSQEEINQLNEAGAPGAQRIIAEHFKLTAKELQNLGGQGLDATEAVKALTKEWTSGKMATAAQRQTKTLGGQWQLLTGNMQKAAGAATSGLAGSLEDKVLPAANRATQAITEIFGRKGLSNEEKLRQARQVIVHELGPIWDDLSDELDRADIPGKLGDAVKAATPKVLDASIDVGKAAAGAFVDGWLNAGPWAQFLTVAFLGNKLRKSDLGKVLLGLGKGGKGAGGLGGALGKGTPVPVFVTNPGFGGPGLPGPATPGPGRRGGTVRTLLRATPELALRAAPPLAIAGGIAEGLNAFLPASAQAAINQNHPTKGRGASSPSNPAGHVPFVPGGLQRAGVPGQQIVVNPVVQAYFTIDGQPLAFATATASAKKKARK